MALEPQQQQQNGQSGGGQVFMVQNEDHGNMMMKSSSNYNNNVCMSSSRQISCSSSTSQRWTPTTEQIRILKDLYYNNGVRSPSADQIQKISAKLRQYGKIEGKNVFYWFQNHKARERQKKRLTTEMNIHPMQQQIRPPGTPPAPAFWRSSHHHQDLPIYPNKCPTFTPPPAGVASSPSASNSSPGSGVHAHVSHFGSYGYGSLAMEKSFRDCSISPGGNGSVVHNFVWAAGPVDHHPYTTSATHPFLDHKKFKCFDDQAHDDDDDDDERLDEFNGGPGPELETLPLFPMHGEEVSAGFCSMKQETESYYSANWYHSCDHARDNMGFSRASLELTLNSYGATRSAHSS